jgi:hypothetical protein
MLNEIYRRHLNNNSFFGKMLDSLLANIPLPFISTNNKLIVKKVAMERTNFMFQPSKLYNDSNKRGKKIIDVPAQ